MHDAYEPVPILEKLPLQIDCLAAWGESVTRCLCRLRPLVCDLPPDVKDQVTVSFSLPTEDWLLVGTKPGHLLLYRIKKDAGTEHDDCVFTDSAYSITLILSLLCRHQPV